jgi:hypothetical protein
MKKILILIAICCAFCFSCNKKIHCPALHHNLYYFPYYNNQVLKYSNSHQDIDTFIIGQTDKTKKYVCEETDKCRCECGCDMYAEFRTHNALENNVTFIYGMLYASGVGEEAGFISSINLDVQLYHNLNYSSNKFKKTLFKDKKISYNDINKYIGDTIIIENTDNEFIHKIAIVKDKGLVSYTTADGEEWKLEE